MKGINVPVFSLKTEKSGGIGEYLDLIPLIDWAADNNIKIIQILPINDSGMDSSPFNLQSAFALNPLYIQWDGLDDKGLNKLAHIDYNDVREIKKNRIDTFSPKANEIEQFVKSHPWVEDYAKYKEGEKSIFEQFLCHQQMKAVKDHADKRRISLMGDIPILVAPDSIDVKLHPDIFLTSLSAGAPADDYSPVPQNWGFPIFNWDTIEKNKYRWWDQRLKWAEEFYHLYRIDHIVGFYRIYATPVHTPFIEGSFYPPNESEWIAHGEKILRNFLKATKMHPIGEDLGTIPDAVRSSMRRLGIPGTKVMRWERKWHEGGRFIPFDEYPQLSMTTVSTHDSEPLRLWWQNNPDEAREWAQFQGLPESTYLTNEMLIKILKASHNTSSLYHVNQLVEYLSAVDGLHSNNSEWDRINRPGIISDHNWAWRMKPTIQEMAKSHSLCEILK